MTRSDLHLEKITLAVAWRTDWRGARGKVGSPVSWLWALHAASPPAGWGVGPSTSVGRQLGRDILHSLGSPV